MKSFSFWRVTVSLDIALSALACASHSAIAQSPPATFHFADDFEGAVLDPFWSSCVKGGTNAVVTTAVAHGGKQSVQLQSFEFAGNKEVELDHRFPSLMFGRTSIWLFDTGADLPSGNYMRLHVLNRQQPEEAVIISTFDYDLGPSNGGNYYYYYSGLPDYNVSPIDRTRAWHQFTIDCQPASLTIEIDGTLVYSGTNRIAFDTVRINMSGPDWRPAWISFWDDFVIDATPANATQTGPFVVTTTADSGLGSLRQAILDANSHPGADRIVFDIPCANQILVQSPLPPITDQVFIDGTTQSGFAGRPIVELSGALIAGAANGLTVINASGCTIQGLVVNQFPGAGIYLVGAPNTILQGNFVGTDVTGTQPMPNGRNQPTSSFYSGIVLIRSPNCQIGGTNAQSRNLVSGNIDGGISIMDSSETMVLGNFIGTDVTGLRPLGNGGNGASVELFNGGVSIGGTNAGATNIISGNLGFGVFFAGGTSQNIVQGNLIGIAADGVSPLGNGRGGVATDAASTDNLVGGRSPGSGNTIAFNVGAGIDWRSGSRNTFLGNSIFGNSEIGIDLNSDGVTPNDPGDADAGANNLQNFPTIQRADQSGTNIVVEYVVDSSPGFSSYPLRVEFFLADVSGRQGKQFLGFDDYGVLSAQIPKVATLNAAVKVGDTIVATATDANGNTSEFSPGFDVSLAPALVTVAIESPTPGSRFPSLSDVEIRARLSDTNAPILQVAFFADGNLLGTRAAAPFVQVWSNAPPGIHSLIVFVTAAGGQTSASDPVPIFIQQQLELVQPLLDQSVTNGANVSFQVQVVGTPPFAYQWRKNGAELVGETMTNLVLTQVTLSDGGAYTVVVSDALTNLISAPAQLKVGGLASQLPGHDLTNRLEITGLNGVSADDRVTSSTRWYGWLAGTNGVATFNTHGSSFDTVLSVYSKDSTGEFTLLGTNDDINRTLTSEVRFNAVKDNSYAIAIDGFDNNSAGSSILQWNLEPSSERIPVIISQPRGATVHLGDSVSLKVQVDSTNVSYQWFVNRTTPLQGATGSSYGIANVDFSKVGTYTVQINDANGLFVESSSADLQIAGDTRAMAVDKYRKLGSAGGAKPQRQGAQRDGSRSGLDVGGGFVSVSAGIPQSGAFGNTTAITQPGEPNAGGQIGGASEFIYFVAADDGLCVFDTRGSTFATTLSVYRSVDRSDLGDNLLASDPTPRQDEHYSEVQLPVVKGTEYVAQIDGRNGSVGIVQYKISLVAKPVITSPPSLIDPPLGFGLILVAPSITGSPPLTFQWYFNGEPVTNANNSTLVLSSFSTANAGIYAVVVSNLSGSTSNAVAILRGSQLSIENLGGTNGMHVRLFQSFPSPVVVEASSNLKSNLIDWIPIYTNSPENRLDFEDSEAIRYQQKFYRARVIDASPP